MKDLGFLVGTFLLVVTGIAGAADMRGTGDLGIVVERAAGRVQVIDSTTRTSLANIPELGDLERSPIRLDSLNVGRGSGTRLGCRA
jgi:protein NirF